MTGWKTSQSKKEQEKENQEFGKMIGEKTSQPRKEIGIENREKDQVLSAH